MTGQELALSFELFVGEKPLVSKALKPPDEFALLVVGLRPHSFGFDGIFQPFGFFGPESFQILAVGFFGLESFLFFSFSLLSALLFKFFSLCFLGL